jgi:salicylate hydroxylase
VLQSDDPAWCSTEGFEIRRWDTGEVLARTAAPSTANFVTIHRGDLQLALFQRAQKLENAEVRLRTRVVDIDVNSTTVYLTTGERITGDLIIVADGVNSTLKWKICPSESETAEPTGDAAYRLILPRRVLENDEELLALVQQPWVKRWDGPNGHVIVYPVHNGELLNVVLIHPDDGLAEESWKSVTEKHHVVTAFEGWDLVLQVSLFLFVQYLSLGSFQE